MAGELSGNNPHVRHLLHISSEGVQRDIGNNRGRKVGAQTLGVNVVRETLYRFRTNPRIASEQIESGDIGPLPN